MSYTYTQGTFGNNDWTYHTSSHFGEDIVYLRVWENFESVLKPFNSYVFLNEDPRVAHFGDEEYLNSNYGSVISNVVDITTYKTAIYISPDGAISLLNKQGNTNPQPIWVWELAKYNAGIGRDQYFAHPFNEGWTKEGTTRLISPDIPVFYDYNNCLDYLNNTDLTNDDPADFGAVYEDDDPVDTDDTSDDVGDNGDFAGIGGAGGLNLIKLCKIDATNINRISDLLSYGWLAGNAGRCVISLKKMLLPQAPAIYSSNVKVIEGTGVQPIDVYADIIAKQIEKVELGSYNFTRYYGDFRDFKPYTSIQLYLPFCGVVDVDPNDVVGGSLHLSCNIDYMTGNIVYYGKVNNDGVNKTIYTWNGNCSIDLPITAEDMSRRLSGALAGLVGGAKSVGAGVVAGGGVGAVAGLATGAISATLGSAMVNPFVSSGNVNSNNGFGGIMEPYIIFRRCKAKNIDPAMFGKPVNSVKSLTDCHGFTKVGQIHLNIPGATKYELDYINNMLKSGVILP